MSHAMTVFCIRGRYCAKTREDMLIADNERAFPELLLDRGIVNAKVLTPDAMLQQQIQKQPLLEWKALNVRRYKGLS